MSGIRTQFQQNKENLGAQLRASGRETAQCAERLLLRAKLIKAELDASPDTIDAILDCAKMEGERQNIHYTIVLDRIYSSLNKAAKDPEYRGRLLKDSTEVKIQDLIAL